MTTCPAEGWSQSHVFTCFHLFSIRSCWESGLREASPRPAGISQRHQLLKGATQAWPAGWPGGPEGLVRACSDQFECSMISEGNQKGNSTPISSEARKTEGTASEKNFQEPRGVPFLSPSESRRSLASRGVATVPSAQKHRDVRSPCQPRHNQNLWREP